MKSTLSWSIYKHFSQKRAFGFTFLDVLREFPGWNREYLARILGYMVKEQMLYKIAHNLYHIIPAESDPKSYLPEPLQIAKYFSLQESYYIGYSKALEIHGLSPPTGNSVAVVTVKQVKQGSREVGGIRCDYIHHNSNRFFGFENFWINPVEQAMVSDLEKTIVDVSTKPIYCGGIVELGKAMLKAKKKTDYSKLCYYFARNGNTPAKKRYLYLTELLGLQWNRSLDQMQKELGETIALLDRTAPYQGKTSSKFALKINVDPIRIRREILQLQ